MESTRVSVFSHRKVFFLSFTFLCFLLLQKISIKSVVIEKCFPKGQALYERSSKKFVESAPNDKKKKKSLHEKKIFAWISKTFASKYVSFNSIFHKFLVSYTLANWNNKKLEYDSPDRMVIWTALFFTVGSLKVLRCAKRWHVVVVEGTRTFRSIVEDF